MKIYFRHFWGNNYIIFLSTHFYHIKNKYVGVSLTILNLNIEIGKIL